MKNEYTYTIMVLGEADENDLFATLLGDAGYHCVIVHTVRDALLGLLRCAPDCIIIALPLTSKDMNDLITTVKRSVKMRLLPIILIAEDNETVRLNAAEWGIDAFLPRPLSEKEFLATVSARLSRYREFYLLSVTDELTKLFNRRELIARFDDFAERGIKPISVAIMDIDFFKKVNDIYGHLVGDKVLTRFSSMLLNRMSDTFIPARFGGEEFVVLFPGTDADEAKAEIDAFREEFSANEFSSADGHKKFNVNFSAGIAEYPKMVSTVSSVLSRADQALYAAKREGRARTYVFRPIMARDDRFWELFQEKNRGVFIGENHSDPVTNIPFLPEALESIIRIPFEVETIGVISLQIRPLFNVIRHGGYQNHFFDMENIRTVIHAACEFHLPTDMIMAIADPVDNDFFMLFPSMVDFPISESKFSSVSQAIMSDINFSLIPYNVSIYSSCGVACYDVRYPRKLYGSLNEIRRRKILLTEEHKDYIAYFRKLMSLFRENRERFFSYFTTVYCRSANDFERTHTMFSLSEHTLKTGLFDILCREMLRPSHLIEEFFSALFSAFSETFSGRIIVPWVPVVGLKTFSRIIGRVAGDIPVTIAVDESHLTDIEPEKFAKVRSHFPPNVSIAIDNCYLGTNLLNYLSMVDVDAIIFSPQLIRNVNFYRDRVKMMSGIKQFADQIGISVIAKGVSSREEFHVISSLGIPYVSGHYIDSLSPGSGQSFDLQANA